MQLGLNGGVDGLGGRLGEELRLGGGLPAVLDRYGDHMWWRIIGRGNGGCSRYCLVHWIGVCAARPLRILNGLLREYLLLPIPLTPLHKPLQLDPIQPLPLLKLRHNRNDRRQIGPILLLTLIQILLQKFFVNLPISIDTLLAPQQSYIQDDESQCEDVGFVGFVDGGWEVLAEGLELAGGEVEWGFVGAAACEQVVCVELFYPGVRDLYDAAVLQVDVVCPH